VSADAAPAWFLAALAAPRESRTTRVADCPIHYLRWGDPGRPGLVLVHGGAAHAHWWSFLAPLFVPQYHVVALDLSGHGDSGRREAYPRETWAEEVLAVAADAGMAAKPILVGHSMGGLVAITAAALHGERLAGAIIVDSPVRRPDPESDEGARGRAFRNPKTYRDRETAVTHFRVMPDQPCENPWILDHIARTSLREFEGGWTWKFDPEVFRRFLPRALHEFLPGVRCRVALVRGAKSEVVSPDTAEYMYELLDRNAPLVEIPEAYHHIMLDQPLALVAALRALLADWEHSTPARPTSGARTPSA
jgi:pimeloyl-ACP methyl ester carboxylesterase